MKEKISSIHNILLIFIGLAYSAIISLYSDDIRGETNKSVFINHKILEDLSKNLFDSNIKNRSEAEKTLISSLFEQTQSKSIQIKELHSDFKSIFLGAILSDQNVKVINQSLEKNSNLFKIYEISELAIGNYIELFSYILVKQCNRNIINLNCLNELIDFLVESEFELKILHSFHELYEIEVIKYFHQNYKIFYEKFLLEFFKKIDKFENLGIDTPFKVILETVEIVFKVLEKPGFDAYFKEKIMRRLIYNCYIYLNNLLFFFAKESGDEKFIQKFTFKFRNGKFVEMIKAQKLSDNPWNRYFFYGYVEYGKFDSALKLLNPNGNIKKWDSDVLLYKLGEKEVISYKEALLKYKSDHDRAYQDGLCLADIYVQKMHPGTLIKMNEEYKKPYDNAVRDVENYLREIDMSLNIKEKLKKYILDKIFVEIKYHWYGWRQIFHDSYIIKLSEAHNKIKVVMKERRIPNVKGNRPDIGYYIFKSVLISLLFICTFLFIILFISLVKSDEKIPK